MNDYVNRYMLAKKDIVERIAAWDRCYPGNLNIEKMVDDAKAEIERLRSALSTAREEGRREGLEELADWVEEVGRLPGRYELAETIRHRALKEKQPTE